MAKVDGPLMSLGARGKVANAIVFFPWKGIHAVRIWKKPANPKTTLMGYIRSALRAISKEIGKISSISSGQLVDSALYLGIAAVTPAGQIWNAYHTKGLLDGIMTSGEVDTTKLEALVGEYSTHAAKTAWDSKATALGLEDHAFEYGYTDNIAAGCQLYFGAISAYRQGANWGTAYNQNPATLAASDVEAFADAHTA